jgi:hypothetical protein
MDFDPVFFKIPAHAYGILVVLAVSWAASDLKTVPAI